MKYRILLINLSWICDSPIRLGWSDIWKVMYYPLIFFARGMASQPFISTKTWQLITISFVYLIHIFLFLLIKQTLLKYWLLVMAFKLNLRHLIVCWRSLMQRSEGWMQILDKGELCEPCQGFIRCGIQNTCTKL